MGRVNPMSLRGRGDCGLPGERQVATSSLSFTRIWIRWGEGRKVIIGGNQRGFKGNPTERRIGAKANCQSFAETTLFSVKKFKRGPTCGNNLPGGCMLLTLGPFNSLRQRALINSKSDADALRKKGVEISQQLKRGRR